MKDNERKALQSGNVLTQTLDENGELVSVKDMNTTEANIDDGVAVADLQKELFDGENVVTSKDTDHGLSRLTNAHGGDQH